MKSLSVWTFLGFIFWSFEARADWLDNWIKDVSDASESIISLGHYDAYIPFYAWHNRFAYDDEHIEKYNEKAFGFGLGKSLHDEKGNWYGLYAFAFEDSNHKLETVAGFAFQKNWNLTADGNWRAGIGYTIGMTQREEYYYIPIPMPLPIAGIEYKDVALQMAYVPGLKNFGNVALFWTRIRIN